MLFVAFAVAKEMANREGDEGKGTEGEVKVNVERVFGIGRKCYSLHCCMPRYDGRKFAKISLF